MNTKEDLINSLVIRLADKSGMSVNELKNEISIGLYDYSINKIETTELSIGNGNVTTSLFRYFEVGKLGSNMTYESIQRYREAVIQLCDFCHKELNMITSEDINVFLYGYRKLKGVQDTTMHSKRLYLSSVFSYLYKHNKIEYNPMELVDPIKCKSKIKTPLSDEEVERIRMACESENSKAKRRDLAIINFMLDTGVRVSELCNINIEDVNFSNKRVIVLGKGNKERYVEFSDRTKVRIEEYFKDRNDLHTNSNGAIYQLNYPLFASIDKNHHRLKKNGIENILKKIGQISGVVRLHPHLLRATYATNLARRGVDINTIAKSLGHANLNTISRYVLVTDEQVNQVIRATSFVA